MNATRFPLSWPVGWKRTQHRTRARFSSYQHMENWQRKRELTVFQALDRLRAELDRLGAREVIISTNLQTRNDGLPRSDQRTPEDPGVAVYFKLKNKPTVLACDKWNRVPDNLAAVAAHIDALRRIDRYGIGTLEQAFAGYAALPPKGGDLDWRSVLGIETQNHVTREAVIARHRELARLHHPDAGGDAETMSRLNAARDRALYELPGG